MEVLNRIADSGLSASAECRSSCPRWAAAVRQRPPRSLENAGRSVWPPGTPRPRSPWTGGPHHTDDTLETLRALRSSFPRPGRSCSPTCTAPRTTAVTWRTPDRGCGSARARTPSRRASPTMINIGRPGLCALSAGADSRRGLSDDRFPRSDLDRDRAQMPRTTSARRIASSSRCCTGSGSHRAATAVLSRVSGAGLRAVRDRLVRIPGPRLAERPANLGFFARAWSPRN